MVRLRRTVRLIFNPSGASGGPNGFGGVPTIQGLGCFTEIEIGCEGFPDVKTGFLINIKEIDLAVRETMYPRLLEWWRSGSAIEPSAMLNELAPRLADQIQSRFQGRLGSVRWRLTPTCSYEVIMNQHKQPGVAVLRQQFEFAASHRLHVWDLDDETNRSMFGKCNNLNGHGHNYVIEPAVALTLGDGPPPLSVEALEAAVDRAVLSRFDHKHLNLDTEQFGERGLNPTVENISKVCFELLKAELDGCDGAELRSVTVWETDRTRCTYPG